MKGKVIIVTRSEPGNQAWIEFLKKRGAAPHYVPTISIKPVKVTPTLSKTLKNMHKFDGVVFTSAAAPRALMHLAKKNNINLDKSLGMNVVAVGKATALAAKRAGYVHIFMPTKANVDALARELTVVKGNSILLLRTKKVSQKIVDVLKKRGAKVVDLPIYCSDPVTGLLSNSNIEADIAVAQLIRRKKIDYLTFASIFSFRNFCGRVSQKELKNLKEIPTITISDRIAAEIKKTGFTNVYVAKKPTIKAIYSEIIKIESK